ncbi:MULTISPECIES: DMT family transporter [unclassified Variovorax]|jgi:drug/metabolite transporter (DMT)-like permease|uniref:DMT family transporter n=1 Tax=unclassified Variovorax TaxID=663243 RepID=UPI000F7EAD31|nr:MULTISPECIES: DMT family transporter [unclassified Variovorax]RSZ44195.1 EamA/RhaT family transporter [Variovorax sp. 553]RSZ45149.1 EamA/RhaT family transporter [Variovorax sp. 679]
MSHRQRLLGIAALLLATSGWGGMFLVGKGVLHHVEPAWFTLIRYSISALLFVLLILPRGAAPWRKLRQHAGPLALRGFAGFGIFSVMLLAGLAHSVPSHGAVIMATTPMTTQLLRWALDGVRPSRSTLVTTALSLLGVAIVSGLLFGTASSGESTLFGDAVAFVGTLGWVWYARGAVRFPELDVIEYTALTVLASWPLLLAMALGSTLLGWSHVPSAEGLRLSWQALLYVGLVSSAISVLAFNYGARTLGAVTGTAFINFVPVSALLMSAALGRLPTVSEAAGMAMVIGALLIHTALSRKASAPAPARIAQPPQNARNYSTCGTASS